MRDSSDPGFRWSLRVRLDAEQGSTVYARNNSFAVGPAVSFREKDPRPSAVEYLLGALGADLSHGFLKHAESRGLRVDGLELTLTGLLEHPLTYIGVIGETGDPYVSEVNGTLYVSADADEETLHAVWQVTLQRSPIANTLRRSTTLSIDLRLVD